jgi:hypothetical protein
MLYQGPDLLEDREPETPALSTFQLRDYETDPFIYKVLTKLPTKEALQAIDEKLPPHLAKIIKDTLENIYSHVTQRIPDENSDHFLHHPASSVYFETHYKVLIKGKDHSKKASSIVHEIKKTIEEIQKRLNQKNMNASQTELATDFLNIFCVHLQAFNKALLLISPSKKAHLKQYQNHDVENVNIMPITPTKQQSIKSVYPTTPSPGKTKSTPKKLSASDRETIDYLQTHKFARKLDFDLEIESSDSDRDFDSDSDSYSGSIGSSSSSESDDEFSTNSPTHLMSWEDKLSQMMDKRMTFTSLYNISTIPSSSAAVKPAPKTKKKLGLGSTLK